MRAASLHHPPPRALNCLTGSLALRELFAFAERGFGMAIVATLGDVNVMGTLIRGQGDVMCLLARRSASPGTTAAPAAGARVRAAGAGRCGVKLHCVVVPGRRQARARAIASSIVSKPRVDDGNSTCAQSQLRSGRPRMRNDSPLGVR